MYNKSGLLKRNHNRLVSWYNYCRGFTVSPPPPPTHPPPTHTHTHTLVTNTQWTLRLDPNDRPSCSQLLRHELFTKGSWSERLTTELRSKVEKELEDNPLLKSLGITIHGSLHDSKQRSSDKISAEPHPVPRKVRSHHYLTITH